MGSWGVRNVTGGGRWVGVNDSGLLIPNDSEKLSDHEMRNEHFWHDSIGSMFLILHTKCS